VRVAATINKLQTRNHGRNGMSGVPAGPIKWHDVASGIF
jgi:hypothetical protein